MSEDKDGEKAADPNAAQNLYALVSGVSDSSDWADFEECLGKLDYQGVLDLVEEDEENPFRHQKNLEDLIRDFAASMLISISSLFSEWIASIDVSQAKRQYRLQSGDLFLTFNCTKELENLYGIPKESICHIHGSSDGNPCIVGHGNHESIAGKYDELISFELGSIHKTLRKPVGKNYGQNQGFFQRAIDSPVDKIVFFGQSLSEANSYYFKRLFESLKHTWRWFLLFVVL